MPSAVVVFTTLMLLHTTLLGMGLSARIPQRFLWSYFVAQGGLVFVIGSVLGLETAVLSLYLALILAAVAILKRARPAAIVAGGYVGLFILSLIVSMGPWVWQNWSTYLATTDYAALVLFVVGFLVLYVQQTRAHAQLESAHAKLEATHGQLQASAERIEALTLVTERQRLARELHDTLAQGVAGLIMQLEAANAQLAQQHPALVQDILCQSLASARATLADARGVIDELRAITTLDEFSKGVHDEISRFHVASGIACHAELCALAVVPADLYEPALRAIREGLNNVAQHAQAQHVWVRIEPEQDERMFAIEVQDDGVGFEPATLTRHPGHYGLIGLRERARLTGGALEVSSAPGTGTLLRLRLPSSTGACAA